ncbi:hypothetical protein CLAIMM_00042 isoform 4 [Cladophialophora immunda]|nr:hypothetical protein CLAIMM_00042 isoform 1 [Cladophialophora immunda]OQU93547.1 hypothetical protein CLAIMM_00042 isoform 2 [Cladophialophora immunda]OQU93548.1 hypothetical protein CLAIMM_00042 isoform 3 [Cladophialophora immunda]OQU93549.1 hypothetical protein CLAIMM_00042 isoform 4 [Cladophialophora immunda]
MDFGWFDDTTPADEFGRTTVHEFRHMLGCVHEQFSPGILFKWNEKAVTAEFTDSKQTPPWTESETRFNFNIFKPLGTTKYPATTLDSDSIMHYAVMVAWTMGPRAGPGGNRWIMLTITMCFRNWTRSSLAGCSRSTDRVFGWQF